ncbi:hypothetical protein ACSBR2_001612 [Camellia fascicularis]
MERGGWTPVLRRRRGGMSGNQYLSEGLFTVFVDYLPNSMDPKRLFFMFGKFGVVKDVFIPAKRRKGTGIRFGFVRYDCRVAADMAIQKADGLWCENKALRVKKADYQKGERNVERAGNRGEAWMGRTSQKVLPQIGLKNQGRRSFAEVVQNDATAEKKRMVVKVREAGNGWLYESLLVVLNSFTAFNEFKDEVKARMEGVRVRSGGGRLAVLTFSSKQQMNDARACMDNWISEWSDYITDWEKGKSIRSERCVWITCMGVPLNVWSVQTFIDIGSLLGEVVQLDNAINNPNSFQYGKVRVATSSVEVINTMVFLECNGSMYPVRVCEDCPPLHVSNQCKREVSDGILDSIIQSAGSMQQTQPGDGGKEGEDDGVHVMMLCQRKRWMWQKMMWCQPMMRIKWKVNFRIKVDVLTEIWEISQSVIWET